MLNVKDADGNIRNFAPSGAVARVVITSAVDGAIDGINVFKTTYGAVDGLPDPVDGVVYAVSRLVLNACVDRADLVSPGDLLRDDKGVVIGANGFSR